MKKRNLIIIAVVAVVGIAALIVALLGSRKATIKQDYHIEDVSTITKIYLADKQDNEVTLNKTEEGIWMVDGMYEANQPVVEALLQTLHEMRMRQQVNKNAVPNVIKDLSARAIKVEVYQRVPFINWFGGRLQLFPHEKRTVTYYVGRETQDMMGSYMYREGDKMPCIIHIPGFRGFITPRFVTEPLKWRSHTIVDLDVNQIARIDLEIPAMPEENFSVVRNGEGFDFELAATHQRVPQFDTARVAQLLSAFSWLCFDEFASIVPNNNADSCINLGVRTILHVTDTAGVTHEVKSYIKYTNPDDLAKVPDPEMYEVFDVDRLYAVIDNKDTVLIQYFVFDNILQPAGYFLGRDISIPVK